MNIVYIISGTSWAPQYEWTARGLKSIHGIEIGFLILYKEVPDLLKQLSNAKFETKFIQCRNKKDWPKAFFTIIFYLIKNKVKIIHTHCIEANILGQSAGFLIGVPERISTRHHSMIHHTQHRKSIIWDYMTNFLCTKIVSVSKNITSILVNYEGIRDDKIIEIPHSIDIDKFNYTSLENKENIRNKYNLVDEKYIIGICSRFEYCKGYDYIIPALGKFLKKNKNAYALFFNSWGVQYDHIMNLSNEHLPDSSFKYVDQIETNMQDAYAIMNIFIHTPINPEEEAFGMVYIESMASGIPCIFSLAGIASQVVRDKENAIVVPHRNSEKIFEALELLYKNEYLANRISQQAKIDVKKYFNKKRMITDLSKLYLENK